jgi:hypothetical protein
MNRPGIGRNPEGEVGFERVISRLGGESIGEIRSVRAFGLVLDEAVMLSD